ncbi:MAG: hypothetical protein H6825_11050 [Planctomycetes bacterium]|nr:hypothetical protein [Planctomycetota bacterium]
MSVTRSVFTAASSLTLLGVLWTPRAQFVTPDPPSRAGVPPAAALDDGPADPGVAPPFTPVARISSLMAGIGWAFGSLRDVLPQIDEEHRLDRIVACSEVIAELSNVHMQHRRKPDYIAMAADTRAIALELARAARADMPDESRFTTLIATLEASCNACHDAQQ